MKYRLLVVTVMATITVLSACSSDNDRGDAEAPASKGATSESASEAIDDPTPTASAPATQESTPALSENEKFVKTFVDALDALDIDHGEAKRTEAGALSKASYDIKINGFDAGIQIFANDETQQSWVKASDSLGGVCVVIDGAALSLNSSEGVANSAEIAPKIAEKVGGEAHGN